MLWTATVTGTAANGDSVVLMITYVIDAAEDETAEEIRNRARMTFEDGYLRNFELWMPATTEIHSVTYEQHAEHAVQSMD